MYKTRQRLLREKTLQPEFSTDSDSLSSFSTPTLEPTLEEEEEEAQVFIDRAGEYEQPELEEIYRKKIPKTSQWGPLPDSIRGQFRHILIDQFRHMLTRDPTVQEEALRSAAHQVDKVAKYTLFPGPISPLLLQMDTEQKIDEAKVIFEQNLVQVATLKHMLEGSRERLKAEIDELEVQKQESEQITRDMTLSTMDEQDEPMDYVQMLLKYPTRLT
ncbi:hypothetical protein BDB01DRAFT_853790 [Pilobolus umbonatus]|nr:hypothetical protein BDB01DRAFT_853790 [Pilobolus umbonatus]